MTSPDISFTQLPAKKGQIGLITLSRPKALNALTLAMCQGIDEHLVQWEEDNTVQAVIIQADGERAFCAGGDVRWVYEVGQRNSELAMDFFRHEYRMNRRLFHFRKPFIAFMHGITMGGGLGISVHGSHRVGAESLVMAMPETGIGFYPDIGGSYFLPKCPGKLGLYLGLTGDRASAADAQYLGLIDFVIDRSDFSNIIDQLTSLTFDHGAHAEVSQLLKNWQLPAKESQMMAHQSDIDHYFSAKTIEAIQQNLLQGSTPLSENILLLLKKKSPTSLKITLDLFNQSAQHDFDTCMALELKLTGSFLKHPDFYEGVRAAVVDKDKSPLWKPAQLSHVPEGLLGAWVA